MIRYLKHSEIDKQRWDDCISNADNRLIYTLSWYLDIVSPGWDALIMNDYAAVMPLTWKKKFGIKYIFKPLFIQQLGVFGNEISADLLELFLDSIPAQYRVADIILNEKNFPEKRNNGFRANKNYKLYTGDSYEKIRENYNRNCKRNIKKARLSGFSFSSAIEPEELFILLTCQIKAQANKFGKIEERMFRYLVNELILKDRGEIVGVRDASDILVAAGFYLFSFDRLIFLICGSTTEGKEKNAMHLLVDEQIKRNAGKYVWYDFSGSNIEGIAYFNSSFGATPDIYYSVSINRLSFLMKLITRKFE